MADLPRRNIRFSIRHYYGNTVRSLLLVGALGMLVAIAFVPELPSGAAAAVVIFAIIMTLFAGLTNPLQYTIAITDTVIAGLGLLFFELLALGLRSKRHDNRED